MDTSRKPLVFTKHAGDAIAERELKQEWIEETAYQPEWQDDDPASPALCGAIVPLHSSAGASCGSSAWKPMPKSVY